MAEVLLEGAWHRVEWQEVRDLEGGYTWRLGLFYQGEEVVGWLEEFRDRFTLFSPLAEPPAAEERRVFCEMKVEFSSLLSFPETEIPLSRPQDEPGFPDPEEAAASARDEPEFSPPEGSSSLALEGSEVSAPEEAGWTWPLGGRGGATPYRLFHDLERCYLLFEGGWYVSHPLVRVGRSPLALLHAEAPASAVQKTPYAAGLALRHIPLPFDLTAFSFFWLAFFLVVRFLSHWRPEIQFAFALILASLIYGVQYAWVQWNSWRLLARYRRLRRWLERLAHGHGDWTPSEERLLRRLSRLWLRLSYVFPATLRQEARQRTLLLSRLFRLLRYHLDWLRPPRRHLLQCLALLNLEQQRGRIREIALQIYKLQQETQHKRQEDSSTGRQKPTAQPAAPLGSQEATADLRQALGQIGEQLTPDLPASLEKVAPPAWLLLWYRDLERKISEADHLRF